MKFKEVFKELEEGKEVHNNGFSFQREKDPKTQELTECIKIKGNVLNSRSLLHCFFGDGWEIIASD